MPPIKKHKSLRILSVVLLLLAIASGSYLSYWETASPQTTCASCHEIESSSNMWAQSGHRSFHCMECHGSAVSNGFHSLKEKGMMLVHHFTETKSQHVRLDESQILEMLNNCKRCHGVEYAKWTSGGHSATYAAIFLNGKHNAVEQPNADCLRCHGMFFNGAIQDLVTPLSVKGPWTLKPAEKSTQPVIPCFTCHKVHRQGVPAVPAEYADPGKIFYERQISPGKALFYDRYEQVHLEAAELPSLQLWDGGRQVNVSDDVRQRLCAQCHAPNAFHQAGTSDDRTPRGVHAGLSCLACHDRHSNDSRKSCIDCHPAISNCLLDVMKMNTSYADKNSPHNIHFVRCIDCHTKGIPKPRTPRL